MKTESQTIHIKSRGWKIAIIAADFHPTITNGLLDGAQRSLKNAGVQPGDVSIIRVPGSLEIPLAAQHLAQSKKYQAIICLGAIIQGETPHFQFVAGECARGIMDVSLKFHLPVTFGVVTALTIEQAIARSNKSDLNRGAEAAVAAISMCNLLYPSTDFS